MGSRRLRRRAYLRVIDRLWTCCGRVSFEEFLEALRRSRAHMSPPLRMLVRPPSHPAFSSILHIYLNKYKIRRRSYSWITKRLTDAIQEGVIRPEWREKDLVEAARKFIIGIHAIVPADRVLRRLTRSARAEVAGRHRESRVAALEHALGIVLQDLPLVKRFEAANELLRYPPAWQGKANLQTMAREADVMEELGEVIRTNGLPVEKMMASPELNAKKDLVERLFPSQVCRRERLSIVESLPFYVVGRWRDARDTVLACFVRKARLLRFNLKALEIEAVRDTSLAFMERSTPRFRALHRAVVKSLESGHVEPLRRQRKFLESIEREGMKLAGQDVYYRLLSGRGGYIRKMARRIVPIPFEGHDAHAWAVVESMREIYRFSPFRIPIPAMVIENLDFLDVPPDQFRRRRVFETVIVMTLADLISSGRVTIPGSLAYGNRWNDIPPLEGLAEYPEPGRWVADLRRELEAKATLFRQHAREEKLVRDGRIHIPRVRLTQKNEGYELESSTLPQVRLPPVDITDLLLDVNEPTGFLDAFKLPGYASRRLGDEERRRLGIAALLDMGLNIGLREVSRSLGRGFALWKLRNFSANYFTVGNLRESLSKIIDAWDKMGLGVAWGPGITCSVDGRVVFSFAKNLLSQYHRRKGRLGVTIYWMIRDDYLAASVRIIGNQEWESWFVLDDLIRPIGKKPLEVSIGDTHGQHLAAWGLAHLLGKGIAVRFRQLGQVKLYGLGPRHWCGLDHMGTIDWERLRRAALSLHRLAEAVKSGRVRPSEILRTWNIYDENGINVTEGLRELGKVKRTGYVLSYAASESSREQVHLGREPSETWNSFQEAIFFGKGGRIETNNPVRREEIGLAMAIVLNAIVFHNVWRHGSRLLKRANATPIVWHHVMLLGRYKITKRRFPSRNGLKI